MPTRFAKQLTNHRCGRPAPHRCPQRPALLPPPRRPATATPPRPRPTPKERTAPRGRSPS
jgi:hypothetical protein